MGDDDFIRPTTGFWQEIRPAGFDVQPPFRYAYPARLPDGRILDLPLRRVPGEPPRAVASLIANQASFAVVHTLARLMAELVHPIRPEVVVGLPTLGFAFAPIVAEKLGHENYVPLGYSRKYWYDEALGEPVRSLTTPGAGKVLYIDPNMLPRIRGRRVVLVDDAISSGQTTVAALRLLARVSTDVAAILVAMKQGDAWRAALAREDKGWPERVLGVFECPRFTRVAEGWIPAAG